MLAIPAVMDWRAAAISDDPVAVEVVALCPLSVIAAARLVRLSCILMSAASWALPPYPCWAALFSTSCRLRSGAVKCVLSDA